MKELVEKKDGKPVLAPGTDPRPEIGINVEDEFEDCSEND